MVINIAPPLKSNIHKHLLWPPHFLQGYCLTHSTAASDALEKYPVYHLFKCIESLMWADMCHVVSIGYRVNGNHILQYMLTLRSHWPTFSHVSVVSAFRKRLVQPRNGSSPLQVGSHPSALQDEQSASISPVPRRELLTYIQGWKCVCEFHYLHSSGYMESVVCKGVLFSLTNELLVSLHSKYDFCQNSFDTVDPFIVFVGQQIPKCLFRHIFFLLWSTTRFYFRSHLIPISS